MTTSILCRTFSGTLLLFSRPSIPLARAEAGGDVVTEEDGCAKGGYEEQLSYHVHNRGDIG